ncbi:NADH dehydrogenase [ubiquinone] 1 subunit C1, mitochondrial isoform X3 [Heterocephalus glaber]|uniref:NADH dehydrogenase [ubiquinone] 1 subunit C1, mitochondrial n=1 Tax=Heterocephalus glaber TaxID=10181 RepID=A0AAX6R7B1_HETGA|nr:NADH dehydrogenase [ubiquinone] 1 subunit C1, mitochondrial isoform X3 [Heterocephalus glaber]
MGSQRRRRRCTLRRQRTSARSKFYVRDPPVDKPNWLKVGLTVGTTAFLWCYVYPSYDYNRCSGLFSLLSCECERSYM